jgi:altronate hydrolase
VPTIKVSSNTAIAEKKPHWIDFNAGALLDGAATLDGWPTSCSRYVLDVASGRVLRRTTRSTATARSPSGRKE